MKTFFSIIVLSVVAVMPDGLAQTRSSVRGQFGTITVTTSSALAPQAGNSYGAGNADDADPRTAWVEGAAGDGIGEWIQVSYDAPMPISSIYFSNGYGKNAKAYSGNSRVREGEIATENGSFLTTLADTNQETTIRLPAPLAGKKTRWVKLTIRSVFPGMTYKDTAIGEFRPDLEEHNYSNGTGN